VDPTTSEPGRSIEQDEYLLTSTEPVNLSDDELAACLRIIDQGRAVDIESAGEELRLGHALVLVRKKSAIVAVGAIKRARPDYAAGISKPRKSGYRFESDMAELGYVAVDERHRGNGLSQVIVTDLIRRYPRPLFATTSNERMKKTLKNAGFQRRGREWKSRTGSPLSLWIRKSGRP